MNITHSSVENKNLSPAQIIKTAIVNSNKYFYQLVLDISFFTFICISAFTPLLAYYANLVKKEAANGISQLFLSTIQNIIYSLTYTSISIIVLFISCIYLFNRTHPSLKNHLKFWSFTRKITIPWTIEGFKACLIIIAGLFLFLIPGIIKYIHYFFFTFVVFFNKEYKAGKLNALKHSKELSRGLRWWIFLLVILFSFIGVIPSKSVDIVLNHTQSLWAVYPTLIFSLYIYCLISAYFYSILYFIYTIKENDKMIEFESLSIENS